MRARTEATALVEPVLTVLLLAALLVRERSAHGIEMHAVGLALALGAATSARWLTRHEPRSRLRALATALALASFAGGVVYPFPGWGLALAGTSAFLEVVRPSGPDPTTSRARPVVGAFAVAAGLAALLLAPGSPLMLLFLGASTLVLAGELFFPASRGRAAAARMLASAGAILGFVVVWYAGSGGEHAGAFGPALGVVLLLARRLAKRPPLGPLLERALAPPVKLAARAATAPESRACRLLLLALGGAIAIFTAIASRDRDLHERLWRAVIPRQNPFWPPYWDLRVILGGVDLARAGQDPLLAPTRLGSFYNYPRVWLLLGALGLGEAQANTAGLLVVSAFLVAACLWLRGASPLRLAVGALFLASPVALFACERGNSDLVVMVLLTLPLLAPRLPGAACVLAAAVLKLFPVPALAAARLLHPRRWLPALVASGALFALYGLAIRRDLALISQATPRPVGDAFGFLVLFSREPFPWAAGLSGALLAVAIAGAVALGRSPGLGGAARALAGPEGAGLLIGGGAYCGAFATGNSYVYRLVFLGLTLPQAVSWLANPRARGTASLLLLLSFLLLWLMPFPGSAAWGLHVLASWALFVIHLATIVGHWLGAEAGERQLLRPSSSASASRAVASTPGNVT